MAALQVLPSALVSAAAAVRCFSLDVVPAALGGGPLLETLTGEFEDRWSRALHDLSDDASSVASSLHDAAVRYVDLERLLVPR